MEFDPWFADNYPNLSEIFPENPHINSEISSIVPLKQRSILSPPPSSHETLLYQNNYMNFQQHPSNGANHYSSLSMEGSFSTSSFSKVPTCSMGNLYQAAHTNGSKTDLVGSCYPIAFSPNFTETESMNGYPKDGTSDFDLINKNPLQYSGVSQSQVGPSQSPLLVYDAHAYVPMKPKLQDELLQIDGMGNNLRESHLTLDVGSQNMQRMVQQESCESHHNGTNIVKHQWTAEEDRILVELVNLYGLKKWVQIAKFLDGRIGKQCWERWTNHLQPNIKKESWSYEEEKILIKAHKEIGNKWTRILRRLPGRTENSIKNHWNSTKRRMIAQRKNNKGKDCEGSLLETYILEVINAKGVK